MITLTNLTLRRGPRVLLENIHWTIYARQRFGIIGENGSGKSTLFALLLQTFQADSGQLTIPRQLKFAYVAQETPSLDQTALDYVLDGDAELRQLEAQLKIAEEQNDGIKIGEIHSQLTHIDAYTAKSRAAILLDGLGFMQHEQQQYVSSFSGGWRVRLNLAKALMCRSDILLLDEPTNHLDLDAVLWLEQWLLRYAGTLIIISHDRDFLDTTVDHIAHLSQQTLKVYTGNYSAFEALRAAELLQQQAIYEKQQKKLVHMQSFVDRFRYKASKARQAQSRLKAIQRMELVCAVQAETPFQFAFKEPKQQPNPLLTIDNGRIAYEEKIVLEHIYLNIAPKERIAVLGPNGAGKTSLIKLLAGELPTSPTIRICSNGLRIGYFAQHQIEHLQLSQSPLEHLKEIAGNTAEIELRKFLGSFGFSGERIFEPVSNFSGGEKSRLALALIVWQNPNLLLLDEPTNHLDLEMRNALSLALQAYEGAMLLVSHDRFLVRTTTDKLLLVANQQLQDFEGDLDDYQQWLVAFRKQYLSSSPSVKENTPKQERQVAAQQREKLRPLTQKINRLESEMNQLKQKEKQLETSLTDQSLYDPKNKAQLQDQLLALSQLKTSIEQTEQAWLQTCEERDLLT